MIDPPGAVPGFTLEIDEMHAFYAMTLRELAEWVTANNNGLFDTGEFPTIDDLNDDEEIAAREEYESMAEEILMAAAIDACDRRESDHA